MDSINTFITSVGFPCALVVFLLWYMGKYINKKDEQNREDTNKQIQEMKSENKENLKIIREESREREMESRKREDKLQNIISELANKFDVVKEVKDKVEEIEEKVSKISEKMDK